MSDDHLTQEDKKNMITAFRKAFEVIARTDPRADPIVDLLRQTEEE